jgi:hypothetical protein
MDFSAGTIIKINEYLIEIHFSKDVEIDEKLSVEILGIILSLSDSKPHALLYDFNNKNIIIADVTRKISAARSYINANLIARAFVTQNIASSMESAFYIKNGNPASETLLFDTRQKAIDWLNIKVKQFLKPA